MKFVLKGILLTAFGSYMKVWLHFSHDSLFIQVFLHVSHVVVCHQQGQVRV